MLTARYAPCRTRCAPCSTIFTHVVHPHSAFLVVLLFSSHATLIVVRRATLATPLSLCHSHCAAPLSLSRLSRRATTLALASHCVAFLLVDKFSSGFNWGLGFCSVITDATIRSLLPSRHEPFLKLSAMDSDTEETKYKLAKKEKNKKHKKKKDVPPQPGRIEVEVEVVHEHPNKTPPVVGYFPSGFDPVKNHGGDGSGPSDFQVYRHRNMPKRLQLVVRPPGSSVEFVGTSFSGEAAAGHRAMYALGVLDKEAGSLKIVPIAGNKIFRLEPKVKGVRTSELEPAHSTLEEMTPQQKFAETTAIWGTKKDIEKAKKKLALTQDDDPDSQRNLDVKLKNVVVNKKALENTEYHVSRNIPPYDTSATTPQEAYVLDKIILKGEWDYLDDIYNNLQQEKEANFSSYPSFVRNRIDRLRKIKDESEKKKISCILSYINHLIKFKDQHSFNVFSAKEHKIPVLLRHKFSNMFAITESKRLPPEKNSLLIYYVLVLTLFSDEFRTDYTDIAKDLSMNALPVRQFYEQLGCKISRQKNMFFATLPVPLKFPELRQRKRKR
ncbi:hypothetical protein VNO78_04878 [Psophocarpus tetragonolobus]|uniref:DNA-directed RNA polymerase I subunit rpa49 n=1 Tax=Psophocarpus tetragonolobus TaxID=3891 RepID=A0AAN9XWW3_PSOTE